LAKLDKIIWNRNFKKFKKNKKSETFKNGVLEIRTMTNFLKKEFWKLTNLKAIKNNNQLIVNFIKKKSWDFHKFIKN
jgi:hypothetical protein